jgi:hypothetical protein
VRDCASGVRRLECVSQVFQLRREHTIAGLQFRNLALQVLDVFRNRFQRFGSTVEEFRA